MLSEFLAGVLIRQGEVEESSEIAGKSAYIVSYFVFPQPYPPYRMPAFQEQLYGVCYL